MNKKKYDVQQNIYTSRKTFKNIILGHLYFFLMYDHTIGLFVFIWHAIKYIIDVSKVI